jgi:hypothetical protein
MRLFRTYLPKLLTGVPDLSKTDAGYRAAGFALRAVLARPVSLPACRIRDFPGWRAGAPARC